MKRRIGILLLLAATMIAAMVIPPDIAVAAGIAPGSQERMAEFTIVSQKAYADPFNDVELDVVFSRKGASWRVPTFWRGGQRWTVRFAPPEPGVYSYRLASNDPANADLNGHEGTIRITAYSGPNDLLRHGPLRVSRNKRHFEHTDGTPFYWLGDTWWMGLSDRLSWDGFQRLTADRKAKGFTLVQLVAGLVPPEEKAPSDPGFCNEGGCVWDSDFKQINPRYFDYADRRIEHLIDAGMVPAIVGGWNGILPKMGMSNMKRHWRYIVARYGAYPVFWIIGGEVVDASDDAKSNSEFLRQRSEPGWTDVTRYVRALDPYHHPLTVHEAVAPYDFPVADETLTDFDLLQAGHAGQGSLAMEVAQLNLHYARTKMVKPVVQGEIGYENFGQGNYEDYQRTAFWLSMLNGAAGHTYGAAGTWISITSDKPMQRIKWSFLTWEEGMNLPGSYQVGIGAKLLRQFPWWEMKPHPEWVLPRGTTFLAPNDRINGYDVGDPNFYIEASKEQVDIEDLLIKRAGPLWLRNNGTYLEPYAAGIPGKLRVIYIPYFSPYTRQMPTVLGLEPGVRYHAYYWEPSLGIRIDLGMIERPKPGRVIFADAMTRNVRTDWKIQGKDNFARSAGRWVLNGDVTMRLSVASLTDFVISANAKGTAFAGMLLRYQDENNYVAAIFDPGSKSAYIRKRTNGDDSAPLGRATFDQVGAVVQMRAEIRGDKAMVSIADGNQVIRSRIADVGTGQAGSAGLIYRGTGGSQSFWNFELRSSPELIRDASLDRKLVDARGQLRGELIGAGAKVRGGEYGWDNYARQKDILLDAYRPPSAPTPGDMILVLETTN